MKTRSQGLAIRSGIRGRKLAANHNNSLLSGVVLGALAIAAIGCAPPPAPSPAPRLIASGYAVYTRDPSTEQSGVYRLTDPDGQTALDNRVLGCGLSESCLCTTALMH